MTDFETTYKNLLSRKHRNEKGQYATGGRKETRLEADEARELWDVAVEVGRAEVVAELRIKENHFVYLADKNAFDGQPIQAGIWRGVASALGGVLYGLADKSITQDAPSLEQGEE